MNASNSGLARRGPMAPLALGSIATAGALLLGLAGPVQAAVVITPTSQTRALNVSADANSVNEPRFGCSSTGTDSDTDNAAAGSFGFFSGEAEATATTPCSNASGGASMYSNIFQSSMFCSGSFGTNAVATGLITSSFGEADVLFDVTFSTSVAAPFFLSGFVNAYGCCFSNSQTTVTLSDVNGGTIYSVSATSSQIGGEQEFVFWNGNLGPGTYRLQVLGDATSPSGDVPSSASGAYDVRLVACDPWCAPPNDNCGGAIDVGEGVHEFSNINATDSGDYPSCAVFADDQIRSDIWYRITADCTGTMTVETCGGTTLDTKIGLYDGTFGGGTCPANPANLELLGCNDDGCGVQSRVTIPVVVGDQILMRLGGYLGAQGSGTFVVSYDCDVPNDICSGAYPVALGATAFSTVNATSGMPDVPDCGVGQPKISKDIWYEFVSTCTGPIQVSTCDNATFDTKIAVYSGCPLPGDLPLACNDDTFDCGLTSSLAFNAVGGSTYIIRVGSFTPTSVPPSSGTGVLTLTCQGLLGDLNGDGFVNGADLGILLAAWGPSEVGDLNGDGVTNGADLGLMLTNWTG